MGGRTNIRQGVELFKRASNYSVLDDISEIPDAFSRSRGDALVQISGGPLSQQELDAYIPILSTDSGKLNTWILLGARHDGLEADMISPPPPLTVPRVFATVGMTNFWEPGVRHRDDPRVEQPEDLVFIAVIAGNRGAAKMKLLVSPSRDNLGSSVLTEVLNGYSAVFTAALFEDEWARRTNVRSTWKVVKTLRELQELRDTPNTESRAIGIVC